MPYHRLSFQHNLIHEGAMQSEKAIMPHPSGYKHQSLQDKLDSSPRSPSKSWHKGLTTPPSSPRLMRSFARLSLNILDFERSLEPPMYRRGHNIIPLPPITPTSPKLFCQNIHRHEEYLSDSAMDVDEYVSLGQQEPSRLPLGTYSSHRLDDLPSASPSLNHLDLPGIPPKNSFLFRIDSERRWQACSAIQNRIFNAGFPEASPFSAFG
ncbi:hypothetical protein BYT27DRAFT_7256970 [Phlegmacium glaucopus]|nr:hypothetical protein BYT27DRAFT_7256970 [Phlegmacium glaucopus]